MMNLFFCFYIATVLIVGMASADDAVRSFGNLFRDWMAEHDVEYDTVATEGDAFDRWIDNHLYIEQVNARNLTYRLAHNRFSDMNVDEFAEWVHTNAGYRGHVLKDVDPYYLRRRNHVLTNDNLPESIDWTEMGAVSPVKDQGQCGSCWSFSATGALEGAYAIKSGKIISLSEQQLVDCDNLAHGGKDHGCNGGLMDNAFAWITKNYGLCTDEDYPYVSGTTQTANACKTTCFPVSGTRPAKFVDVTPNDDNALMTAVSLQPVSVAIEADQRDFQLYSSGVFTGVCGTNLDHGVLVVGYGTSNDGTDFYKVKNSWSVSWGSQGYIYLGRGPKYNGGAGQCGILMEASFPVLSSGAI
jgi:C1A family cysteine protease